jgi:hypothetical protein
MSNGEGDELHCSLVFLEGRDEGDVLVRLGFEFVFTSQVPAESDLDDDESAEFLLKEVRSGEGESGTPMA